MKPNERFETVQPCGTAQPARDLPAAAVGDPDALAQQAPRSRLRRGLLQAAGAAAVAPGVARAQTVTSYNIPSLSDFSGPFSSIMPSFGSAREAVIAWWNAEVGGKLGVKLVLKPYDTRYDTAQTASLWPGVLAEKPLIGFALGGPDTAALQQRLPTDKVVMILGSASNGFGWRPNQWVISPRPTFVHELAGFIDWFQKNRVGGSRPVKVAMVTSEASPSYADMGRGVAAYIKANPKVAELVEMVYAEVQPADLTLQIRRVLNGGAEVVLAPASIQQAIAVKRAMQALNRKVPIVYSMHNAPTSIARPLGGMQAMEGDFEAQSGVVTADEDSEAKRFYDMLVSRYSLKAPWISLTGAGIGQALMLVRTVEAAARKHGGSKLTGEMMHATILETEFKGKDFFGYSHDMSFGVGAPFPTFAPKVNVGEVKGGKLVTAATGWAVPRLERW